ncbi:MULTISPECIES: hypothetical protein [unclassified Streptomyces]|uniref:hypothetical protein n=1 Tax=unclassified Streptomyces TaxID=2593676 RepID=UPI002E2FF4EF|nr:MULTISPECIES: hypothetical protein [unclassified Streptomyces]
MKAVARGTAVAVALTLSLTACEGGSAQTGKAATSGAVTGGSASGGAAKGSATAGAPTTGKKASDSPAEGGERSSAPAATQQPITPRMPPVWVDATGLYYALPTERNIGDVFVDGDPVLVQDGAARSACSEETKTQCAGVQAAGKKEMEARGNADKTRYEFTLFTFETEAQAGTAMKGLAEQRRKSSAEDGVPAKPLTVDSGADATEAFRDGDVNHVVMRIGTVVADVLVHIHADDIARSNVEHAAVVQVARVKSVSSGIDPDR